MRKIFANEAADRGLISKAYRQFIQLHVKKKKDSTIKTWAEDLNRHFSKDIWMAKKHMKRCSRSLIIREMEIKTAGRYWFTLVRMTIIKKSTDNKCWKVWRKGSLPTLLRGNVN